MAEQEKAVVRNIMEELVEMKIMSIVRGLGVCDCEICLNDIRALALNRLPPRYAVCTGGGIYIIVSAMSDQAQADIVAAITNAVRIVSSNPRHPV